MSNPIQDVRLKHGLSRRSLAALGRCAYHSVYAAERGLPLTPHPGILEALEALGYAPADVMAQYRAYRRTIGESAMGKGPRESTSGE